MRRSRGRLVLTASASKSLLTLYRPSGEASPPHRTVSPPCLNSSPTRKSRFQSSSSGSSELAAAPMSHDRQSSWLANCCSAQVVGLVPVSDVGATVRRTRRNAGVVINERRSSPPDPGGIWQPRPCRARRLGRARSVRRRGRPWPAWSRRKGSPPDWHRCFRAACRSTATP